MIICRILSVVLYCISFDARWWRIFLAFRIDKKLKLLSTLHFIVESNHAGFSSNLQNVANIVLFFSLMNGLFRKFFDIKTVWPLLGVGIAFRLGFSFDILMGEVEASGNSFIGESLPSAFFFLFSSLICIISNFHFFSKCSCNHQLQAISFFVSSFAIHYVILLHWIWFYFLFCFY